MRCLLCGGCEVKLLCSFVLVKSIQIQVGLIRKFRYPVEQYPVLTKDGYLLSLVRIPLSRGIPKAFKTRPGPPVLLVHGIISSADDWVLNYPWNSPGFLLSDAGYDVWLLNTRGTPYSRHLKHQKRSTAYWDYSFDDIGLFDVTAGIDFVLRSTGFYRVTLIGWSQGSTDIFVTLSLRPEYNAKVKLFVALAPVANITHLNSPITMFIPFKGIIKTTVDLFNGGGIFPSSRTSRTLYHHLCNSHIRALCYMPVTMGVGISPHQLNRTRIPVYMAHMPSGTSTKNLVHMAQNRNRKDFCRFDYGEKENIWRYGTSYAPRYPLHKITAPIALFWGKNDRLATPEDVSTLRKEIHHAIVYDYLVPDPQFAHLDFMIGINANHLLHEPIIHLLNRFHHGEHLGLYRPELHQTYVGPPIPPFPLPPLDAHKNPLRLPVFGIKFASIPVGGSWKKPSLPITIQAPPHLPTVPTHLSQVPPQKLQPPSLSVAPSLQAISRPRTPDTQLQLVGSDFVQFGQAYSLQQQLPKSLSVGSHSNFGAFHHSQPVMPQAIPPELFLFHSEDNFFGKVFRPPPARRSYPTSSHRITHFLQRPHINVKKVNQRLHLEDTNKKVTPHFSTSGSIADHPSVPVQRAMLVPPAECFANHGLRRKRVIMHPDNNGGFQTDWFPVTQGFQELTLYDLLPSVSTRGQSEVFALPDPRQAQANISFHGNTDSDKKKTILRGSIRGPHQMYGKGL
ncbi:uncharacterized protein LOC111246432 [Varroa destructor]|uniref:Partial AB-hydrolase lipase domain-containing protein n=1 Tax=Varroa destructor TaxID=109461 RepID=A0A7M7JVG8_VARDE|nr:uncharacterized protein LOC111246432 [Varroa destructor]